MRVTIEVAATCLEELADRALTGEEVISTRQGGRNIRLERVPEDESPALVYRLEPSGD